MNKRITTLTLLAALVFGLFALVPKLTGLRLPGYHQGYEPTQPIAYSHRLHAGELAIECQYCHSGAERSRHAGIPAADVCMNCHGYVTAPRSAVRAEELRAEEAGESPAKVISPELAKLYRAIGLDDELEPDATLTPRPIEWVRVHHLPDYAYFDHRPHVYAGIDCQKCHGPVETMERLRQVKSLSMGWCVNCHRDPHEAGLGGAPVATIDCSACHY